MKDKNFYLDLSKIRQKEDRVRFKSFRKSKQSLRNSRSQNNFKKRLSSRNSPQKNFIKENIRQLNKIPKIKNLEKASLNEKKSEFQEERTHQKKLSGRKSSKRKRSKNELGKDTLALEILGKIDPEKYEIFFNPDDKNYYYLKKQDKKPVKGEKVIKERVEEDEYLKIVEIDYEEKETETKEEEIGYPKIFFTKCFSFNPRNIKERIPNSKTLIDEEKQRGYYKFLISDFQSEKKIEKKLKDFQFYLKKQLRIRLGESEEIDFLSSEELKDKKTEFSCSSVSIEDFKNEFNELNDEKEENHLIVEIDTKFQPIKIIPKKGLFSNTIVTKPPKIAITKIDPIKDENLKDYFSDPLNFDKYDDFKNNL